MKRFFIFLFLLIFPHAILNAAEDYYSFTSKSDQQRFHTLTTELRCLVCQNQNIAESNASLATDLRDQIYKKIQRGESNKEIISYLTARYGHFVMYRPPFEISTLVLWFGPFLILFFGVVYLIHYLKSSGRQSR